MEWLVAKGVLDKEGGVALAGAGEAASFRIPGDSGRKTALARRLLEPFAKQGEALLWIREYGTWPSSEDPRLFAGFRMSLGERKTLADAPGHLFTDTDMAAVASMLGMVLYFSWGAIAASPGGGVLVEISHDEMLDIFVQTGSTELDRWVEGIKKALGPRDASR